MNAFLSNVVFTILALTFGAVCFQLGVNSVSTDQPVKELRA